MRLSAQALLASDRCIKWLFVAPIVILFLAITIYPLVSALWMSFSQWELSIAEKPFIGLINYQQLLTDDARFANAMQRSVQIIVPALALEFLIGFGLALLFSGEFTGKRLFTALMLIPIMISPVVVGFTGRSAFTMQYGFINDLLAKLVGHPVVINWLSDPRMAPVTIMLMDVWQWTPFIFLILLSGLMALPVEPVEAASIDGANSLQIFWYITLPQMRYLILVALLIRGLELVKLFDIIMLATRAGPGIATETIAVYIYNLGFKYWNLGYAAAASFLLLIVVIILANLAIRLLSTAREQG